MSANNETTDDLTGDQLFLALKEKRNAAGRGHYERIALAARLLTDRDWVTDPSKGGGDEFRAMDRLEEECFGDLCGAVSLPALLDIYHNVKDVKVWEKYKFDLKKIWAEWKAKQKPTPRKAGAPAQPRVRHLTTPEEFEHLTAGRQRGEYQKAFRAVESDGQKIARLEEENAELRADNERLKAENAALKAKARELFAYKVG